MNENQTGAEGSASPIIADALTNDAKAHVAGRFDEIGLQYDDVCAETLPSSRPATRTVAIALAFWDGWIDSRNHDWQYYPGIEHQDWPPLANEIAAALRSGDEITNPTLLRLFTPQLRRSIPKWIGDLFRRPATR